MTMLTSCTTEEVVDGADVPTVDPWRRAVHYVDPAGRFELEFPAAPKLSDEPDGQLVIHTLHAAVGRGWSFDLAWSDAPPGASLRLTQTIRPDTPEASARRDGGAVTARSTVSVFGRDALDFTVEARNGERGLYRDREMVLGGRLYELTVIQRAGNRAAFDRFVRSFRLLEPPVRPGAHFFARAGALCTSLFAAAPKTPDNATPAQRGAAVSKGADLYVLIAKTLAKTPAAPDEQGDAAAMIDAMRRAVAPARRFAEAVRQDRPNARALGRATHADTDLVDEIGVRRGAASCA
jgi:hypothetical protein